MIEPIIRDTKSINLMSANERLDRYRENMRRIKEIAPSKEVAKTELLYYGDKEENYK